MTKFIRDHVAKCKAIRDIGEHLPAVDPAVVANALGAEPITKRARGGSPLSVFLIRQELGKAMQRGASAHSLDNATAEGVAIPLADQEWRQLQQLAASLADGNTGPTAAEVAGALLKLSLQTPNLDLLHQELLSQGIGNGNAAPPPII